jgi:hypothetical protein
MNNLGQRSVEPPSERTRVKRRAQRGVYDPAVIRGILDEGLVCHLGFTVDGQPFVIPTTYGRVGDTLYVHGSAANRTLRSLRSGIEACVTVTLIDGLVMARSAFHHSMNYRSVVVFGRATEVTDPGEKVEALRAIVEHVVPGRWGEVRGPSEKELQATLVLALPLEEASAKVRTGGPLDEPQDMTLPVWAGELPLRLAVLSPVDDPHVLVGIEPTSAIVAYGRPSATAENDR